MILENNKVKIICLNNNGGKISSIFDKENDLEFLFQNPKKEYSSASLYSDFSQFEACGFDDTFPSIDKEDVIFPSKKIAYPDHGEIWSAKFSIKNYSKDNISLIYYSKILPYSFEKNITLNNKQLVINYLIKNTGEFDFPCFYTFHCLIDSKEGIELITPQDNKEIKIVHHSNRFEKNKVYKYPITDNQIDLSKPELLENGECEKFYFTQRSNNGVIGYNYTKEKIKLLISYDSNKLPYLGFWNTQGGFRNDYNFALEMSNGYYDSISIARENNACPILKRNETFSFAIKFDIIKYSK